MSARAAARGGKARPAARVRPPARTKKPGLGAQLGKLWASLPIPRAFLRTLRNWLLVLLLIAGVIAGLVVRNVQVEGREHVDRDAIYRAVADANGQDMALVDLSAMRANLLGLPWVQDARVSRRLPDTLVIDIVERAPVAIWQYQQRLALIDKAGGVIAPLDPAHVPDQLPLVIGRGANGHALELEALIGSQPVLKPLIADGAWVGDRRWDLHFTSGETLSLPEGDQAAREALASFARRDAESHLLGHGIVRFDMRDPKRTIVRVANDPSLRLDRMEPVVPEPAKAAPTAKPATDAEPAAQTISQEKIL